ncbi:MAG TPA: aldose 1-epimerase family protein [Candidatus Sulfotelmatobacter sp.]|jgi:galactose mutarotase-like enzyme|nr:aldose 1-epimerase family protein [Candidatus Sulfotelmatobacter sp.]
MDCHTITGDRLSATVKALGAELCSLRGADGQEALWQAGPEWPRHAPLLFPIVGKVKDDRYRLDGKDYSLGQHGFARDSLFTWVETGPDHCRLRLEDSAATRAHYPFAFRFDVIYRIDGDRLDIVFEISNPGDEPLPASAGAHPAFRWPLRDGIPRQAHRLDFAEAEHHPIRRLGPGALLDPAPFSSPVEGKTLTLTDDLFKISAIIFERPVSASLRYTAPEAPVIEVSWQGFSQLGVWTKLGADFVCIEPWQGMTSPADFDGDFRDKPHLLLIPPGTSRQLRHSIRVMV